MATLKDNKTDQAPTVHSGVMPASKHSSKKPLIILGAAILVLICVGGYAYYHQQHQKNIVTPPTENRVYTTTQLTNHQLAGASSGTGMSFNLPAAFVARTGGSSKGLARQQYFSELPASGAPLNLSGAYASTAAYIIGQSPPASFLANYQTNLAAGDQTVINGQKQLATTILQSTNFAHRQITYQSFGLFSNPNIKQGAWIADFTALSGSSRVPNYQGKIVHVITNKATYNFYIYAYSYNWTNPANQGTWQQVLNSLKVDQ